MKALGLGMTLRRLRQGGWPFGCLSIGVSLGHIPNQHTIDGFAQSLRKPFGVGIVERGLAPYVGAEKVAHAVAGPELPAIAHDRASLSMLG